MGLAVWSWPGQGDGGNDAGVVNVPRAVCGQRLLLTTC
ncbi:hypothetical protein CCP3SC1AL1_1420004 [Gammaproteobacteria bacterium]